MHSFVSVSSRFVLAGTLLAALAACGGGSQPTGSSTLPNVARQLAGVPFAAATPPVTAPVTIPYPFTNSYTTTTWSGPTAKPVVSLGNESGLITVKFQLDAKTGVYLVPETIKSDAGYTEVLNSAITFPKYKNGTAQIILSDNYTYVQGAFTETGMDTYPQTQNSFDFPLTKGRRWSAAAAHTSYANSVQTGKGAFAQNVSSTTAANGEYIGQTSFSSTNGAANQDNYASTTIVALGIPSIFTLAEPAAGYNQLTQTFGPASGNRIPVVSSGKKPIPFKAGTVRVPNWYPGGGALPSTLYSDNYVVTGTAKMPSQCGKRAGQTATVVLETYASLDPVQGEYDTGKTSYYMASLATGQYWFACIVEGYTDTTYANGWAMSNGNWGKPSSQQSGTEVLVATGAKPSTVDLRAIAGLHSLSVVSPMAARLRYAGLGQAHSRR